jgi:hypothetical protein
MLENLNLTFFVRKFRPEKVLQDRLLHDGVEDVGAGGLRQVGGEEVGEAAAFRIVFVSRRFPDLEQHPRKKFRHVLAAKIGEPAVDVMIMIFVDFRQFSAKKLALFLQKNNVMIRILQTLAVFLYQRTPIFSPNFLAKIFLKS